MNNSDGIENVHRTKRNKALRVVTIQDCGDGFHSLKYTPIKKNMDYNAEIQ